MQVQHRGKRSPGRRLAPTRLVGFLAGLSVVAQGLIGCEGKQPQVAAAQQTYVIRLAAPPGEAAAKGAKTGPQAFENFAQIPEGLGVCIHFRGAPRDELARIAQAGFKIVRTDMRWNEVERTRGVYDFARSKHDAQVNAMVKLGLRPLYILDYNNRLYRPDLPKGRSKVEAGIGSSEERQAFARYASAAAKRYAGKGVLWEIWNEPNHPKFWGPEPNAAGYVALVRAVSKVIRESDPGALILGPALSQIPFDWIQKVLELGLLRYIDGFTVHPYRGTSPETVADDYRRLRSLLSKYALPGRGAVPILSGEWGYSLVSYRGNDLSEHEQADYAIKSFWSNIAAGIPVSLWYDWRRGADKQDRFENFGLTTSTGASTRTLSALSALMKHFEGFRFSHRVSMPNPDDHALVLAKGTQQALVLWTRSFSAPHRVRIERPAKVVRDSLGRRVVTTDRAQWVQITNEPRYYFF